MKVEIIKSDKPNKRFMAIFTDNKKKIKTTHFGSRGKSYIDHNDDKLKENYLKRHKPRENWNDKFNSFLEVLTIVSNKHHLTQKGFDRILEIKGEWST